MFYWLCGVVSIGLFTFLAFKVAGDMQVKVDDLPSEFERYQSFDSAKVVRSQNLSMALFLESAEDIQYHLTPENHLITYSVQNKTENIFKKINTNGEVIDSLTIHDKPLNIVFVNGYIIHKKGQYYTWTFDGRKQALPITGQNDDFKWDLKKQREQISDIENSSPWVLVDFDYVNPEPVKTVGDEIPTTQAMTTYSMLTYFQNGKCFRFYTTLDVTDRFPYTYREKLLLNNPFKRYNPKIQGRKEIISLPQVQYRYYQKLKLEKVRFSGGGGNAAPFDVMLYHGNLFTDVVYKNDTLKLKEFIYQFNDGSRSPIQIDGKRIGTLTQNKAQPPAIMDGYMYYTNENLAFALFTNDDKKLYMIR